MLEIEQKRVPKLSKLGSSVAKRIAKQLVSRTFVKFLSPGEFRKGSYEETQPRHLIDLARKKRVFKQHDQ